MILLKCEKHQRYEGNINPKDCLTITDPCCPACQHIYLVRLAAEKKQGVVVEAGVWLAKLETP